MEVPQIDIKALISTISSDTERQNVLIQIDGAMRNIGFMSVVNHGVPQEVIENAVHTAKRFFQLPPESKMSIAPKHLNPSNSNTYRGYIPSSVFGKECWDIADPSRKVREDPTDFTTELNKFPDEMTNEQIKSIEDYFTALHGLTSKLVKAIYDIFGADPTMAGIITRRPEAEVTMRLNHYPQHEEGYSPAEISAHDGTKFCCETHADSGLLTVLYQDNVGGLQVQSPNTNQWLDVPCNPEAFVVNTGVAMQRLTNDQYKATYHRVKMSSLERLSIPLFFLGPPASDIDSRVLCPNEEPLYPVTTWKQFNIDRMSQFKEYKDRIA